MVTVPSGYCACAVSRDQSLGENGTFFEILTQLCVFTLSLTWRYDED